MGCKLHSSPSSSVANAFLKAFHVSPDWWRRSRQDSFGSKKKNIGGARGVIGRRLGKGGAVQVGFQIA